MLDITNLLERMEFLEDRSGVSISGLSAFIADQSDQDGEFKIRISGEVLSTQPSIVASFDIVVVIYDNQGRVVNKKTEWVDSSNFSGFYVFCISAYTNIETIGKIRIFPSP
jgi:hypothetical protein